MPESHQSRLVWLLSEPSPSSSLHFPSAGVTRACYHTWLSISVLGNKPKSPVYPLLSYLLRQTVFVKHGMDHVSGSQTHCGPSFRVSVSSPLGAGLLSPSYHNRLSWNALPNLKVSVDSSGSSLDLKKRAEISGSQN